ncbi:MAG TPA: RNA pyrophosphohydrolase [Candidatus Cybelea sp.]|nr:RNA pyrophosphohydrolase [Candidatus Cybelea sp.]
MSRKPPPYKDRPYRPGVGMMLFDGKGRVFVGRRIDQTAEAWQMPQGGIDDGEDPRTSALRELEEEIGTDKAEIIAESRDWLIYDLPPDLADRVWKGRYRGQKQKWFALRFLGRDKDIDLGKHHPEFDAWRWVALDDVPGVIVPFKRDLYERIVAEFRHLAKAR